MKSLDQLKFSNQSRREKNKTRNQNHMATNEKVPSTNVFKAAIVYTKRRYNKISNNVSRILHLNVQLRNFFPQTIE